MNIIRNPKNKFGDMLLNIATTIILPELIGKVSDTILNNVTTPKKEERVYTQHPEKIVQPIIYSDCSSSSVREKNNEKDMNVNINLNIVANNPGECNKPKRHTHSINPNMYIPMYIDCTRDV